MNVALLNWILINYSTLIYGRLFFIYCLLWLYWRYILDQFIDQPHCEIGQYLSKFKPMYSYGFEFFFEFFKFFFKKLFNILHFTLFPNFLYIFMIISYFTYLYFYTYIPILYLTIEFSVDCWWCVFKIFF